MSRRYQVNAPDLDALCEARQKSLAVRGLVAECACSKSYTLAAFVYLPLAGRDESNEHRTCSCGSTITRVRPVWLEALRELGNVHAPIFWSLNVERAVWLESLADLQTWIDGFRWGASSKGADRGETDALWQIHRAIENEKRCQLSAPPERYDGRLALVHAG